MKSRLTMFVTIVICVVLIMGGCGGSSGNSLQTGDKHPDFNLKGIDTNSYSLSQFQNKKVMLIYVYRGCEGCEIEMPFVEAAYKNIKQNINVVVIFRTGDDIMKITDYVNSKKWTLSPILIDEGDAIYKQYGLPDVRPVNVLLDTNGRIKSVKPGAFKNQTDVENWVK